MISKKTLCKSLKMQISTNDRLWSYFYNFFLTNVVVIL